MKLLNKMRNGGQRAFTMIEIAISLAIIGFALAAIVGILPIGMNVQKENRQETIVNQDGQVFMDLIRNGARGLDDLTNYVYVISNSISGYTTKGAMDVRTFSYRYTTTNSTTPSQFPLTNGLRIIGLLSTPTYIPRYDANGNYIGYFSNRVSAFVRSMSGLASEKYPAAERRQAKLRFHLSAHSGNRHVLDQLL